MRNMGSKIPNFTLETEKSKPPTSSSVSTCMLMYYTSYCKNQPVIMVICLSWTRAASLKHQIYDKLSLKSYLERKITNFVPISKDPPKTKEIPRTNESSSTSTSARHCTMFVLPCCRPYTQCRNIPTSIHLPKQWYKKTRSISHPSAIPPGF